MATFNTAFGALQTPQDVANRSTQPSGGIRLDRMVNQQMPSLPGQQQLQAQMQTQQRQQQQAKPAPQQTFAQMQQAGQARPAPMPAPVSIGMPMAQQPVLLSQLQSQLGSPNMGAIQQQEQQQRQQLLRQQALQDAVQQQRQQLQYQMDKQNQQRRQGLIQNLSPEQRAIYQQAQTLGPDIDPLAVAMGGASALERVKGSAPDVPATEEVGLITDPSRFLAYTSFAPQTGEPAFTSSVTPQPTAGQFVEQTPFPTRGPELDVDYTPGTGNFLPTFEPRAAFNTPAFGPTPETPSQVSNLPGAVGGYRTAATATEAARAGQQADIYNTLSALSAPAQATTGPGPATLGPTQMATPRAAPPAPATVAPITGAQTPDTLERLRQSMAQGAGTQMSDVAAQAMQRQAEASTRAAAQGAGVVPTMAAPAPPAGATQVQRFAPQQYTAAGAMPTMAPVPTSLGPTPAAQAAGQEASQLGILGQAPVFEGSPQAQQMRDALQQQLQAFAQTPTRFDTEAFQQMRAAQQGMLEREFGAQRSQLEEELARRGLSASTIGAGRFGDLAGQQALAQAQIDAQLLQEAARTQAEDRSNLLLQMSQLAEMSGAQDIAQYQARLAGQQQQFAQGLQAAETTGALGGVQTLEAQRLAEEQRQFDVQQQLRQTLGLGELGISQQNVNLRAREIVQQAEQAGRSLNIDEARVQAQQEQFVAQLEEQRAGRLQNFGITQQQLNQEAQRIQQAEKGLSLEEARDQAEVGFRAQQLMQQDRTLSLDEAQFVVGAELERDKYNAQREQFRQTLDEDTRRFEASLEEQRSQRLQNFNISQTQLDQEAYRLQQADRTLDLQDARDRAEVGIRTQQLMQQDRTLDLQEARERANEEIQIAALAEETAARLERNGLSRDDLNLRAEQVRYDAALRGEEIDVQKAIKEAEFQLQRERIASDYAMQGRDINSRETLAEIERQTRKYIADQSTNLSYEKIKADTENFDKEISARKVEAAARFELNKTDLLLQLASALGITGLKDVAKDLPTYNPNANPKIGNTPGEE
jgi:hypothetical protein